MTTKTSRRTVVKGGAAALGMGVLGVPEWAFPALAQQEEVVPFTDISEEFGGQRAGSLTRIYDIRNIDGPYTPADEFYAIQHFDQPVIDPGSYRLTISGLIERPVELTVDDLQALGRQDVDAGYECSGNSGRVIQGLASNGRWSGVPLRTVLEHVGIQDSARELVFVGADKGPESVDFRGRAYEVEQPFARSLSLPSGLSTEPLLAYALNDAPLTKEQGAPVRLVVPGWYGVSNVKWLTHIRAQAERFLGKWQARWYRTLWAEEIAGETVWHETEITRLRVKSVIARVTRSASEHTVMGFVLNDGTPLESVEVRVDDGPWEQATLDASMTNPYGWKLFRYTWNGATPGEHTLVSRATDVNGVVQPTSEELSIKQTGLEDNSQFPRTLTIS